MNILVIGNGFDIAHGLPTSYKDFLKFTDDFEMYYQAQKERRAPGWNDADDTRFVRWLVDAFDEARSNEIYSDLVKELHEMIHENLWLQHFKDVQIAEGWVDFEKEISRIIKTIDEAVKSGKVPVDKNTGKFSSKLEEYVFEIISPYFEGQAATEGIRKIHELKDRLLGDLNRVTRALELYLSYFVEEESNYIPLPLIKSLKIDRVLSFNYTHTFEKLYWAKDIKYDYIHGKAKKGLDVNTCNLVLGIDEYQTGIDRDTDNEFIEFKKFYQRIYKRTGSEYKNWLGHYNEYVDRTPKANHDDIQIYFYGHSLDVTDRDIIAELIRQKNAKTTIYYHNRKALAQQISNLVKVLGEDELVERTGGYKPTVTFKPVERDVFDEINNVDGGAV